MTAALPEAHPRPPADDASRARIASNLEETLFVEAGAGTGKTSALVRRVRELAASGACPLRHVAAITFTEAAAAELRDRVRRDLEQAAAATDDDTVRARLGEALDQVDEAGILTLHGFAQQLLAEHPLEAGLPPELEVLDELAAAERFDRRWQDFLDTLLADRAMAEPVETLLTLGMRPEQLAEIARALDEHHDRLIAADCLPEPPAPDVSGMLDELEAVSEARHRCTDPADKLARHLEGLAALAAEARAHPRPLDAFGVLAAAGLKKHAGAKAAWNGEQDAVRERLRALHDARERLARDLFGHALHRVLERVRAWVLESAQQRAREGVLTFHDLLVRARDLVRDHPQARRRARQRWRRLLIDEFQDTDPLQVELALALVAEGALPDDLWQAAVPDGALFFVGDPKQSIYRFRRADLEVYAKAGARFAGGAESLRVSFRSDPRIVAWVNTVMGPLLHGQAGLGGFVPLLAHRPPGDEGPAVHAIGEPLPELSAGQRYEQEGRDVAAAVAAIVGEGWGVDDGRGGRRPAEFDDVAILLPRRTALPAIERALEEHGIPYRVEASSLIHQSQEARELLALLRAVDDPTDQVAVVAALRIPAMGCGDDDLLAWVEGGGSWDYRRAGGEGPVAAGLALLARLHVQRLRRDCGALLDELVAQLRLLETATALPRPRDAWRRLRCLIDEARAFAAAGGGLRDLVARLERQAAEGARVTEQIVPDEDDPAVRILTVHAAKGLEFPVTVLAGLSTTTEAGGRGARVLWDSRGAVQVRCRLGVETAGFATAAKLDAARAREERLRLLYVAATRARDHLVLCLHHRPGSRSDGEDDRAGQGSLAEVLHQADLQAGEAAARRWRPEPLASGQARLGRERDAEPQWTDPAAWHSARTALLAGQHDPVLAATRLTGGHVDEPDEPGYGPRDESGDESGGGQGAPWRRGRGGTPVGRAVHAVLQSIDLTDWERELDALAAAQAAAEQLPGQAAHVARLARSALTSAPVAEALASGRWWRELPVAADLGGVLVEGFVDLLYEDAAGRLCLVDWKTDQVSGERLAARLPGYEIQLGAYALLLRAALGREVARAALVFARPDGAPAPAHEAADLVALADAALRGVEDATR